MPSLIEGMRRLYPVEDVRRLAYTQSPGGDVVSVDVHGMKCWQAKQFINNIINLSNRPFHLTVIHRSAFPGGAAQGMSAGRGA